MASKAIDRTIDMLLRNLRTEVARLETELRLSKMEAEGLRYQLQAVKRDKEIVDMIGGAK